MAKRREIRNSTAEFLIFQIEGKEQGIEVYYKDKTVWCTQKAMGMLFDCDRSVVTKHLRNIFDSEELNESEVCAKFAHTASDGKTYQTQFYNLDAVRATPSFSNKSSTESYSVTRPCLTSSIAAL